MSDPLGDGKDILLGEHAFIEDEEELASIRAKALNGVGEAGGKEPQVSLGNVLDLHGSVGTEYRNAR